MIKKTGFITLFVLFAGVLVYGAVNRTVAKSETADRTVTQSQAANDRHSNEGELSSQSNRGHGSQESFDQQIGQENQDHSSQGHGNQVQVSPVQVSQGQGNQVQVSPVQVSQGQGQGLNQQRETTDIQEQSMISGVVVQAPAYGVDMILETAEGEALIGTGPGYLDEQGFVILLGDSVGVTGFWEDEEFKAVEITLLDSGKSIILRDEMGRPMWSGAGRKAINLQISQYRG